MMSIDSSRRIMMASSANDVFTAICGGTFVYPAVMYEQYQDIRVTNRDGVTPGSIREITYGHGKYLLIIFNYYIFVFNLQLIIIYIYI
ncbi:unnamed protein product [Linum tenue]|uniref:Uncharacterized protein n=1 Tax=Linum tenue TaxID=586396 RepID=A0AAV0L356_9ROSI|nr:unnamed protein product [Linum tenue]CAI0428885.1 unnamed protein product [Linum tenue]CAI0428891.1 unnamed protein product [Linum tenue]